MAGGFVVHLGGGAYLDASGRLTFGPPENAQIYQPPGGFHLELKWLQDAAKELSGLLPSDDEGKAKWVKWGVPVDIADFFVKSAGVVSIAATAVGVYVWAIGFLLKILDVTGSDDGMSPATAKALQSIKNQLRGGEQIYRADEMIGMHSQVHGRIARMQGLITRLAVEQPIGQTRAEVFAEMRNVVDELAVPLARVLNEDWAVTYDSEQYKGQFFAADLLVRHRSNGTIEPVGAAPPTTTHFDYRLGVPMLLYVTETYAALAQVAMPWFRSAGMYAGQLRRAAEAIDRFVMRMQDESLARTRYTADTVFRQSNWSIFEVPMGGGPRPWHELWPPAPPLAVGAFDLVRYDDNFLTERWGAQFAVGERTGPRGLFNYRWETEETGYQSLDRVAEECNEQARKDYARLQLATGMLPLIATAAWLRFLSTPPDRSQTVTGAVTDSRRHLDTAPTTAESPWIFPSGVIKVEATLKRYVAGSRAQIRTQEPGYVPAFRYRVVLRTLNSVSTGGGWAGADYVGDVWRPRYERTARDPRINRLSTELRRQWVLSEIVLYDGSSPRDAQQRIGERMIQASTFDWYVPVLSPWGSFTDSELTWHVAGVGGGATKTAKATGGRSIHLWTRRRTVAGAGEAAIDVQANRAAGITAEPSPIPMMGRSGPLGRAAADDLVEMGDGFALAEESLSKAERRHVRNEEVWLRWQLDWKADRLQVRLFGRPEDRPFQVHVVVEETVYSGEPFSDDIATPLDQSALREQLHTPFACEVVNQLIHVPESFFRSEGKALEDGKRMWYDFLDRFTESRQVGPSEPVERLERSLGELAIRSQSTATLAENMERRFDFARQEAPELWEAVVDGHSTAPHESTGERTAEA